MLLLRIVCITRLAVMLAMRHIVYAVALPGSSNTDTPVVEYFKFFVCQ